MEEYRDLSQETLNSQELFQDGNYPGHDLENMQEQHLNSDNIKAILTELKHLRREVEELKGLMCRNNGKAFQVETCSFKDRLHHFLRSLFTKIFWMNAQNEDFQTEVQSCLKYENAEKDSSAFRKVS
nr:uncharacterized protein LOC111107697 [Crassostrea virginica]